MTFAAKRLSELRERERERQGGRAKAHNNNNNKKKGKTNKKSYHHVLNSLIYSSFIKVSSLFLKLQDENIDFSSSFQEAAVAAAAKFILYFI